MANVTGTQGRDTLTGTDSDDIIEGLGGDDSLYGYKGSDTLRGGDGNDYLETGRWDGNAYVDDGGDLLDGGAGNDRLYGASGNDTLIGGAGNDNLSGGGGIDRMTGGAGDDSYVLDRIDDVVVEAEDEGRDGIQLQLAAAGTYALPANVESLSLISNGGAWGLTLTGNALDNALNLGAGNDVVDGGAGNDQIYGGMGADTLRGGDGNDYIQTGQWTAGVYVDDASDILDGGAGNDNLDASTANDTLLGGAGNDYLNGGGGLDNMIGGEGNDTYVLDRTGDVVVEAEGEGSDGIQLQLAAAGSYVLPANVENLFFTPGGGAWGLTLTGNALDNALNLGAGNDVVDGGAGNDQIFGGLGADTLRGGDGVDYIQAGQWNGTAYADDAGDTLDGGAGNDNLYGSSGSDHLIGGAGNDGLNGGAGADLMAGGLGDDNYTLDRTDDLVVEAEGEGRDYIVLQLAAAGSYTLPANVETLYFTSVDGAWGLSLTGNALDNMLTLGAGNDHVDGGAGNDQIWGGKGADLLRGGDGDDYIQGGQWDGTAYVDDAGDTLEGGAGSDRLYGGIAGDSLFGGDGNDTLSGGGDVDSLVGGAGDDFYMLDRTDDLVVEAEGQGRDSVQLQLTASGTYTLPANVEGLGVSFNEGVWDLTLMGNALDNTLTSGAGNDVIDAGAGNDYVFGGAGNDVLIGGAGNDQLTGSDGNDTLDNRGGGSDHLDGGAGDDVYLISRNGAVISEAANGGNDKIIITSGGIKVSGIANVESVEYTNDALPLAYWVDALAQGSYWSTPGSPGTVSYGFIATNSDPTFQAFAAADQARCKDALALWAKSCGLTFVETSDLSTAQIRFGFFDLSKSGAGGTGGYPNPNGSSTVSIDDGAAGGPMATQDGWFHILVHEIGHALGLKHPGDYNAGGGGGEAPFLPAAEDYVGNTHLSYNYGASDGSTAIQTTLRPFDVSTAQFLYGVSPNLNAGDTVYKYSQLAWPGTLIGDGGGTDTLDASDVMPLGGTGPDMTIDLREGARIFSGPAQALITTAGQVSINYNTVIENAIGSAGRDAITGNAANNVLSGGAGDDTLYGSAGDDTLIGGTGADSLDGGEGWDTASYANAASAVTVDLAQGKASGGEGADVLRGVESLIGSAFDDTFTGNAVDNRFDGGQGVDTVVYSGSWASYLVRAGQGAVTVRAADGHIGVDTLVGIEKLVFDDRTLSLAEALKPRATPSDFNGDGKSDLLWRNGASGEGAIWLGASAANGQSVAAVSNLKWSVVGMGDFDGDGKSDLLWRNADSGEGTIWKSGSAAAPMDVAAVVNLNWKVVGIGDFDGDGKSDILWRSATSGEGTIWKSGSAATSMDVAAVVNLNWKVAGIGDFDGDGKSDILWRSATSGEGIIWKGGSAASTMEVAAVVNLNWKVAGIGDFDGDGKSDLLWRNDLSGQATIWKSASASTPMDVLSVSNLNWRIAAVGDYDGDGKSDLLWRNGTTGESTIWKGASASAGMDVLQVSNLNWKVIGGAVTQLGDNGVAVNAAGSPAGSDLLSFAGLDRATASVANWFDEPAGEHSLASAPASLVHQDPATWDLHAIDMAGAMHDAALDGHTWMGHQAYAGDYLLP